MSPAENKQGGRPTQTKSVPDFKLSFARFNASVSIGVESEGTKSGLIKSASQRKTDEAEDAEDWS